MAQLALMLPLEREQSQLLALVLGEPQGVGYVVLLGSYVRGLDTMEWDVYAPRLAADGRAELRPLASSYFKGQFEFRRRR